MLSRTDIDEITTLTTRLVREAINEQNRGRLGIPVDRLAVVATDASIGASVAVKIDGDVSPITALNFCGVSLAAGARVLVRFVPPNGVYIVNVVSQRSTPYPGAWAGTTTSPTIGTGGGIQSTYRVDGGVCFVSFYVLIGSGFVDGVGNYSWSIPIKANPDRRQAIAVRGVYNTGADSLEGHGIIHAGATAISDLLVNGTSTTSLFLVSPGTPGFGVGDWLAMTGSYDIAPTG